MAGLLLTQVLGAALVCVPALVRGASSITASGPGGLVPGSASCSPDGQYYLSTHNSLYRFDAELDEYVQQLDEDTPGNRLGPVPPKDICVIQEQAALASSSDARLNTNAARFARGLPPLPPSSRRRRDLQRRQNPSTIPVPPVPSVRGYVSLSDAQDNLIGYVGNTLNQYNDYAITQSDSTANALIVVLPSTTPFGTTFNLPTENGPDATYPYFAAGFSRFNGFLAFTSACQLTTLDGPDSACRATDASGGQTQIWSIAPRTLELTANVRNKNAGGTRLTVLGYDAGAGELDIADQPRSGLTALIVRFVPIV